MTKNYSLREMLWNTIPYGVILSSMGIGLVSNYVRQQDGKDATIKAEMTHKTEMKIVHGDLADRVYTSNITRRHYK